MVWQLTRTFTSFSSALILSVAVQRLNAFVRRIRLKPAFSKARTARRACPRPFAQTLFRVPDYYRVVSFSTCDCADDACEVQPRILPRLKTRAARILNLLAVSVGDLNFCVAAWHGCVNCRNNRRNHLLDSRPARREQHINPCASSG